MSVVAVSKSVSLRSVRRRFSVLSNLERQLTPAELAEWCDLRQALRRELFGRIQLDKR